MRCAREHDRGAAGRFAPGLPRISDGQLLFLLHMLAHAKDPKEGGSRIAIIMNGSPLFTGDAGSGESEIRRFLLEHDLLEALVALPEQLFYNTGIATYVWVVTNRKAQARKGKVQLIDATSFWVPMRKSLGDKRREIPLDRAQDIVKILGTFEDGDTRKITQRWEGRRIERERERERDLPDDPLRLPQDHCRAPAATELPGHTGACRAARRRETLPGARAVDEEGCRRRETAGRRPRDAGEDPRAPARVSGHLSQGPRGVSSACSTPPSKRPALQLSAPAKKAILSALSERDEDAAICREQGWQPGSPIRSCATRKACRFLRATIPSTPRDCPPAYGRSSNAK